MKPFTNVPLWLSAFVTVTFTAPASCAGVVAVIKLVLTRTTFVAGTPPIDTAGDAKKLLPVMLIDVPPAVGPLFGLTALTMGAGSAPPLPLLFGRIVLSFTTAPGEVLK